MIKVAKIEEHLKNQDEKVSDIKIMMVGVDKKLTDFIECQNKKIDELDKKFAPIWVRNFLLWAGITIGAGILGILGAIIMGHLTIKI